MKNELGALMLWIDRKLNRNQDVLVTKIDSIQNLFENSSEASASAADILEGKTAFNGTVLMTGIMENQGAKEATLLAGGTYNIPRGYHDGAGRVMATDLASQTPGTAAAGGILSGLKAWVAGKLIDGAMKDRRGVTVTAASVAQDNEYTYLTIPEEGCYDANSKLRTLNSNIVPKLILNYKINAGTFFDLNTQKYQTLKVKVSSAMDWTNGTLYVYGGDTIIAEISDLNEHTYNISNYSTVKITGRHKGGNLGYGDVSGQVSLQ